MAVRVKKSIFKSAISGWDGFRRKMLGVTIGGVGCFQLFKLRLALL
jgi:hypothetical protein